jgi:transcriptional regulator MraZ
MLMLWGQVVVSGEKWTVLLTGTYERALDEKLRLALPKALREALAREKQLVLTPGTDGSLSLFSGRVFASLAERLAARSPTGQDVRAFSRLLYAQSHGVDVDSQGRIRLPVELARLANLDGDVVLLGVGDRIELWNKSRWEAYLADLQPRYDQLAETALSEGLVSQELRHERQQQTVAAMHPVQPR